MWKIPALVELQTAGLERQNTNAEAFLCTETGSTLNVFLEYFLTVKITYFLEHHWLALCVRIYNTLDTWQK